jgi:hypothetical protein
MTPYRRRWWTKLIYAIGVMFFLGAIGAAPAALFVVCTLDDLRT